jgi:hypothetical protein
MSSNTTEKNHEYSVPCDQCGTYVSVDEIIFNGVMQESYCPWCNEELQSPSALKKIFADWQEVYAPKQESDPVVDKVVDAYKSRSKTGIEKYGTTLHKNNLTLLEWLNHLQEELMDATLYIEKLKDHARKI